jgi:hypothetical protein
LCSNDTSRTRSSCVISARTASPLPSVEPSSTKMISVRRPSLPSAASSSSHSSGTLSTSFSIGTTTDSSMF